MTYAVPPSDKPRSRRTLIIGVIVGVLLVLCCGAVVSVFLVLNSVQTATAPVKDSVDVFLRHLEAGETDAAYDSLCAQTRGEFTQVRFAQTVNNRPKIVGYANLGSNVSNVNGHLSASVNSKLTYADGRSETHMFQLVNEPGGWRICGHPY